MNFQLWCILGLPMLWCIWKLSSASSSNWSGLLFSWSEWCSKHFDKHIREICFPTGPSLAMYYQFGEMCKNKFWTHFLKYDDQTHNLVKCLKCLSWNYLWIVDERLSSKINSMDFKNWIYKSNLVYFSKNHNNHNALK